MSDPRPRQYKKRECVAREYDLRIYTPKIVIIPEQKSVRRLVFSIKNLHYELKGPTFDSLLVHIC